MICPLSYLAANGVAKYAMQNLDEFKTTFPFLSGIRIQTHEYIGIIQNSDDRVISFYDYCALKTDEEKKLLLELGETWWWESSRTLPINVFLTGQLKPFRYYLKTIINKDVEILFGPCTSLNDLMQKRIKKRQIQLIRRID